MVSLHPSASAVPCVSTFQAAFVLFLFRNDLLHILKKVLGKLTHPLKIFVLRHIHYDDNSI